VSQQKVLLINPAHTTEIGRVLRLKAPPLGLLYLAAYLEGAGIPVEIFDADLHDLSPAQTARRVLSRNPSIIGVTATTDAINSANRVVDHIRAASQAPVIVAGGVHPTFMPQQTLRDCPGLDLVVLGEGEQTLLELTRALSGFQWDHEQEFNRRYASEKGLEFARRISSVRGIGYRKTENPGEVILTPHRPVIEDLDKIPLPARHLVAFDQYKLMGKDTAIGAVMTSRGCPFACTYCCSSRTLGKRYRARSPENVVREIRLLCETYHLKHIELVDDIFTLDQKRAVRFSELMTAERLDVRWIASSRVDTISRGAMQAMSKAGLEMLYFGVESGSQRVLDLMKKGTSTKQAQSAFSLARSAGVKTAGSFILGYPGETLSEMWQTIRFARTLDPEYAQFCILTPYPGTPIYDDLKGKGLLTTEEWERYNGLEPVIKYEAFGCRSEMVKRMVSNAYLSFYLRPVYLARHLGLIPAIIRAYVAPRLLDR
jgi:radical SAM superfamily enzyme YgiQ (UPF0313 family)